MLEGGGLCSHKDDCTERSTTDLGSSKNFANQIDLPAFQSSDEISNPDWYQANQVFIPYCTGDVHSGTRTETSDETFGFYFSGHHVVSSVVDDLKQNKGLDNADLIIFAGASAGGMGVITNVDYVASKLSNAKVLGVPIGGYIFAHENYQGDGAVIEPENARAQDFERDAELFQGFNSQRGSKCATELRNTSWECEIPTTNFLFVESPMFVIESQIDSVIMFDFSNAPEVNTSEVASYVEKFRTNSTKYAQVVVESKTATIFSVSCFMHTNFDRGSPTVDGTDYYNMLYSAAHAVLDGTSLPESKVDACEGIPCGTNCPAM